MSRYYHVARLPGQLGSEPVLLPMRWASQKDGGTEFLTRLLPSEISHHGIRYIGGTGKRPKDDSNGVIELLAEFIRQSHFPDRPSRFSSFFAWKTLEDARHFAQSHPAISSEDQPILENEIWIVESDSIVFEADMKWLDLGRVWPHALINLCRYWEGYLSDHPQIEVLLPLPVKIIERAE